MSLNLKNTFLGESVSIDSIFSASMLRLCIIEFMQNTFLSGCFQQNVIKFIDEICIGYLGLLLAGRRLEKLMVVTITNK